jgi:predicted  nucleic acid-binding Zn-ribbon protein
MAQNQQFLQDFQSSMDKLNGMNDMIQNSLKQKKEFSDNLVAKLKDINQKIKDLAGQINQLKASVDSLQGQVSNNSGAISSKDKQIADLTQKITALEGEKQQLSEQLTNFQKQCNDEKAALQQKIDADEASIRKLTEDNEALKKQSDALTAELANNGATAAQHAEQIKTQTEEFQKQMAQAQQENQTKIDGLMAQIKDCDDKMLDLQKQLKDKTDEAAAHAQSITDTQTQGQSQVAKLNQDIEALKKENDDLIQRIIAATQAIKQATENLEILANSVPNQQSEQYINQLFTEIEESIKNISGVLQGNPIQPGPQPGPQPQPGQPQKINSSQLITVQVPGGALQQVPFSNIIAGVQKKAGQSGNVQKYKDALGPLRQATTPQQVTDILNQFNISYKNGSIMGGKKTKKIRKQKGGFTYKLNSKRKGLSTSYRRGNSSRRTSR